MGVSTNALIAFGFDLGEAGDREVDLSELFPDPDGGDEPQLDEWLLEKAGVVFKNGMNYDDFKKKRDKVLAACPVALVEHCSNEHPMYLLAVRGTVKVARRGYAEPFELPQVSQEQIEAAKAFCDEHGIEWETPKWTLFSYWG